MVPKLFVVLILSEVREREREIQRERREVTTKTNSVIKCRN